MIEQGLRKVYPHNIVWEGYESQTFLSNNQTILDQGRGLRSLFELVQLQTAVFVGGTVHSFLSVAGSIIL